MLHRHLRHRNIIKIINLKEKIRTSFTNEVSVDFQINVIKVQNTVTEHNRKKRIEIVKNKLFVVVCVTGDGVGGGSGGKLREGEGA